MRPADLKETVSLMSRRSILTLKDPQENAGAVICALVVQSRHHASSRDCLASYVDAWLQICREAFTRHARCGADNAFVMRTTTGMVCLYEGWPPHVLRHNPPYRFSHCQWSSISLSDESSSSTHCGAHYCGGSANTLCCCRAQRPFEWTAGNYDAETNS